MKGKTLLLLAIFGAIIFDILIYKHQAAPVVQQYSYWEQIPLIDLHIPETVTTQQTSYHIQIPVTAVSMVVPVGYEQTIDLKGYQKGMDTCIDVVEDHSAGIDTKRKELNSYLAYTKKDSWRDQSVVYHKDFRFNGYDAFMVYVTDAKNSKSAIYMAFGDKAFNVSMSGTMTVPTQENCDEIVRTMLTTFYPRA